MVGVSGTGQSEQAPATAGEPTDDPSETAWDGPSVTVARGVGSLLVGDARFRTAEPG